MKIRRYLESDWPRLCAIHDLARMDELRRSNLVDAFLPLEIAAETEGLFDYDMLVAEQDEMVLGFVAYSPEELAWLYIDPRSYRTGIGGRLARSALEARPGRMCAEVLRGNDAALSFYKAIGFVETGVVKGRMPGNERFLVSVHCLEYNGDA